MHFLQVSPASNAILNLLILFLDENGVALREDLLQNLQGGTSGSRRRPRIVTAASSPLMAKVVTSAIRVSNHQSVRDGKYMPQITNLKVGK